MELDRLVRQATVPTISFPEPFTRKRVEQAIPVGSTVWDIVGVLLPDQDLLPFAVVTLNGSELDRAYWKIVKPKAGTRLVLNVVPKGGGATRYLLMAAVVIAAIIAAVFQQYWLSGIILSVGMTAINVLMPPPLPPVANNKSSTPSYAISGARNRSNLWGKLPFVCGTFRVVPAYGATPIRELTGGTNYWRTIFALGHGPLKLEDLRIGETRLSDFKEVETELRRGYHSLPDLGLWSFPGGRYPTSPTFGDTYTVASAISVSGAKYAATDTITFNGLADAQTSDAWDLNQGKPFKLFPEDIYEDTFNVELLSLKPIVRATKTDCSELSADIMIDRLYHVQNMPAGQRKNWDISFKIEQAVIGTNDWKVVATQTISTNTTTPFYWGKRWKPEDVGPVAALGQYDIRVTRTSSDEDGDRHFGKAYLVCVRSIRTNSPIPQANACLLAMRIKASGQLQGQIDEFNCIATSIAKDYDYISNKWIWRPTSNPAALCRHIVQYPMRWSPLLDSQVDLERLEHWSEICRSKKQLFNGTFDNAGSLYDAIVTIARVGRASPTLRDVKFSVIIDEPKDTPVRIFTPRNSFNYSGEISYIPSPHAYRGSFANAKKGYETDEIIVYDDGYTAANATRVERLEWVGVTDSDQIFRETRYHLAQQRLRREIHHVECDMENLCCERGDLVGLHQDVIAVGLSSGRITDLQLSGDGSQVFGVHVDTPVVMTAGTTYGLRVGQFVNGQEKAVLHALQPMEGTLSDILFLSPVPIAEAPMEGDLFAFGILGRETLSVLVRDIEPQEDLSAKITLISEAPGVHTADTAPIPAYDPMITTPQSMTAPQVLSIASDASVMLITPNRTLLPRVVFNIRQEPLPDGTTTVVMFKVSGAEESTWEVATAQEYQGPSLYVTGVQTGVTYDFRITRSNPRFLTSPTTTVNSYRVIGREGAPLALQNLNLQIAGGQALLRWDLPADIDVQVGGWIEFRHSSLLTGAVWSNSYTLGRSVNGDQTHVWLPLKPGTYMGKVFDADGRESVTVASISTTQASVHNFVSVATIEESPLFAGVKSFMSVVDDFLQLTATDFDTTAEIDEVPDFDTLGQSISASGLYKFLLGFDFGTIRRVRITSKIEMQIVNLYSTIDARGEIDSWPDVDGVLGAPVDIQVWAKTTNQDPNSGVVAWSDFIRVDASEVSCRGIGQIEARVTTLDQTYTVNIIKLGINADGVS